MGDKKGKGIGAETNDHKVLMKLYIRALLTNLKRPLEKGQVFVLLDCLVCWDAIRYLSSQVVRNVALGGTLRG